MDTKDTLVIALGGGEFLTSLKNLGLRRYDRYTRYTNRSISDFLDRFGDVLMLSPSYNVVVIHDLFPQYI